MSPRRRGAPAPLKLSAVAPAKVNLGLEVIGRRPDGYHELVTLLQAVSLYDVFEWTDTGDTFHYKGSADVSAESDIVARVLKTAPDRDRWTGRLRLRKHIPLAAGLGGGSSDAALALQLAFPGASRTDLHDHAAAFGADVPFFLVGATAVATGIGTTLDWAPTPRSWLVLVTPPLAIDRKTESLYDGLTNEDFTDGRRTRKLLERLTTPVYLDGQSNRPGGNTVADFPNAFLRQLLEHDVVRYAYDALRRAGAENNTVAVSASGAGPTVYALTRLLGDATCIAKQLPDDIGSVRIVHSIGTRMRANDQSIERMARALRRT